MDSYNKNNYAVIMAGGVGSRFWPVSTSSFPKQFHDLLGMGQSLLQKTVNRFSNIVPRENIFILTNRNYLELVQDQLPNIKRERIILEPAMRNTAPCILLAALKIKKENQEAVMVVAPSDHWIQEEELFIEDIQEAFKHAKSENKLITLGVIPTSPHTGYGYVEFEKIEGQKLQKVERFIEKPTLRKAKQFLEEGKYLWNAGIFIWKASYIIECFIEFQPEMHKLLNAAPEKLNSPKEEDFIEEVYNDAQNISIDYAVMEKSNDTWVIPASFHWNDLGTWGSIYNQLAQDEQGNAVVNAQLFPVKSKGNMIYSHRQKLVVVEGMENFIIIEDKDILLIVPKEREQEIKEMRSKVMQKFGDNFG